MQEHGFGSRNRSQKHASDRKCDDKIQYFLSAEELLLQQISSRAPLPGVLNGICTALDCQIGGIVSLISLPDDSASELGTIATNAALFGLFVFSSEGIVAENNQFLGTLEIYSSARRSPSADELQLIQRATCLAAIAIKFDKDEGHKSNSGLNEKRPVRAPVLEWPVSPN
jgi:hypothetical protein